MTAVQRARPAVAAAVALGIAVGVLWPAPPGVLVQGAIIGGLTALIAFGIALVYRSNRAVNFAQGDLGAAPAGLGVLLIGVWGWPFLPSLAAALATGAVLGLLVEVAIVRRFFRAPRLILSVATIGLSQVLAGVALFLPSWFGSDYPPNRFAPPIDLTFTIHPLRFDGNDVLALAAVPLCIAALWWFFQRTRLGIAVRASADSAERAFLAGIPVHRVHAVVWMIASTLATLAVFLRAGVVGLPIGEVLGPSILLRALTAAAIGRMERLPTIFGAAVGLGVLEQAIVWDTGSSTLVAPIIFVAVVGVLLVQRRRQVARGDDDEGAWTDVREARPIPAELATVPEVRHGRRALIAAGVAVLALLPLVIPGSRTNLLGVILIFAIVAMSLVVLTGWAGQVSLGQMAIVGIGSAVAGALSTRLGWDILLCLLAAGVVGAVVSVVVGLPALRLSGLFLAVTSLAFALATSSWILNRSRFGWWLPTGRIHRTPLFGRIDVSGEVAYYWLVLAALLAAWLAVRGIRSSRAGRVLVAVRQNPRGAQSYGMTVAGAKLTAFAVSGFLAAFAGGLLAFHQHSLGITLFAPEQSLAVFTMVVIGGLGSLGGALIGALYVRGIDYFLPPEVGFLAGGIGVVVVLWLAPAGLGAVLHQARDGVLRWVARRRRIVVPSLLADAADFEAADRRRRLVAEVTMEAVMDSAAAAAAAGAAGAAGGSGGTSLVSTGDSSNPRRTAAATEGT